MIAVNGNDDDIEDANKKESVPAVTESAKNKPEVKKEEPKIEEPKKEDTKITLIQKI